MKWMRRNTAIIYKIIKGGNNLAKIINLTKIIACTSLKTKTIEALY